MAEMKARQNDQDVAAFVGGIGDEQRRRDAQVVLELMREVTGEEPPRENRPRLPETGTICARELLAMGDPPRGRAGGGQAEDRGAGRPAG